MRSALPLVFLGISIVVVVACVGGGGSLDDGSSGSTGPAPTGTATSEPGPDPTTTATTTLPPINVTIAAAEFRQSCAEDGDCAAVYEGPVCSPCRCAKAAIHRDDSGKYETTLAERRSQCGPPPEVACSPCQAVRPACNPATRTCGIAVPDGG